MEGILNQFRASQMWKILLPLALASDTLGLYDVIPEPVRQFASIPLVNLIMLMMFVVETGADLTIAGGLFLIMAVLYVKNNGISALIQPRPKDEDFRTY